MHLMAWPSYIYVSAKILWLANMLASFPYSTFLTDLCALLLVSLWHKYNWPRLTECVLVHLLLLSHNMLDMKAFSRLAIIYNPYLEHSKIS